ncbi:MAG: CPBP family intramembrane glutamic endopeptidase [Edaphobacter sp.]
MHALNPTIHRRSERTLQLALFVTSVAWFLAADAVAAHAARGLSERFALDAGRPLLTSLFLLFLLAVGFSLLQTIANRRSSLREVLGLPKRPTSGREWMLGAALGWGLVVLAVLPMAVAGTFNIQLWTQPRAFTLLLLNLATLAVAALVEEVAFRGYAFRRLIESIGPVAATLVMSSLFGLGHVLNPGASWTSTLVTMLAGLLLSVAWLRTHGLWLGWGFHFAWNASMGALFGLPVSGITDFASVVQTRTFGRLWLTGGDYGPEAAGFTVIVLLAGIAILVRITRDYAWHYTYAPIVPAGYPMEAPPPAAHAAMEQQARPAPAAASLVQILPVTPQARSVSDEPQP